MSYQMNADDEDIVSGEQQQYHKTPLLYQASYSHTCVFSKSRDIFTFKRKNYKISISVGILTSVVVPYTVTLTDFVKTNLVQKDLLAVS